MMPVLLADALTVYYIVGVVVVPILVGGVAFLSSRRATAGFSRRVGMELRGESPVPVSDACPECGSLRSTKAKAKDHFLISLDRECAICGSHYARPFPKWLSWSFVVLGAALIVGGVGLGVYVGHRFPDDRFASVAVLVVGVGIGFQSLLAGIGKLRVAHART